MLQTSKSKVPFALSTSRGGHDRVLARAATTIAARTLATRAILRVTWNSKPRRILIMKRWKDPRLAAKVEALMSWLRSEGLEVTLWSDAAPDAGLASADFAVCIGGDGTMALLSSLFSGPAPPVVAFGAGSMNFLAAFEEHTLRKTLATILARGTVSCQMRMRLTCSIYRASAGAGPSPSPSSSSSSTTTPSLRAAEQTHVVLNDVVLLRDGPQLGLLDIDVNGVPLTVAQGDGLIVATPTGSTAYSLAAGGSIVHHAVPAICITPIAPHSLSFRPLLVADDCTITVRVPHDARCAAKMSFDGRVGTQVALRRGDSATIRMCKWPLPTVMPFVEAGEDYTRRGVGAWIKSVTTSLGWNVRMRQRGMLDDEEQQEEEEDGGGCEAAGGGAGTPGGEDGGGRAKL